MATAEQIRFAAACALGARDGFVATYSPRAQRVDIWQEPEHEQRPQRLPQNLFPLHPFRAFVHNVTPGQWWQAMSDVLHNDLMRADDWAEAGCAPPACRVAEHVAPAYVPSCVPEHIDDDADTIPRGPVGHA